MSNKDLVPVHSELVHAGFLDYVKALPQHGSLFPGLTRRASKGKIGARLGFPQEAHCTRHQA